MAVKRVPALFLALCLMMTWLPSGALAAGQREDAAADPDANGASVRAETPEGTEGAVDFGAGLSAGPLTGVDENGAPLDWTEAEEADRADASTGEDAALAAVGKLSTPTELEWGVDYHRFIGKEAQGQRTEFPGMFSWRLGTLRQYHYEVRIYQKTADGDVLVDEVKTWYGGDRGGNVELEDGSRRASCFRFLLKEPESGDYYFTVRAAGDGNSYESSDTATSGIWHYTKAEEQLQTPERPVFDEERHMFSWRVPDSALACQNHVCFFYAPDRDAEPVEAGNGSIFDVEADRENFHSLADYALEEYGSGWYSIQVRTLSRNLDLLDSSGWSERSEAVYMESNSGRLGEILRDLTEQSDDTEKQAAVEAVRQMDPEALASLMAADQDGSGAAGDIARLEELTGTRAAVEISDAVRDSFDPNRISVVGAGLNVDVGQRAALKLGEPDADAIIPTMYGNTLQFSMTLENGEDQIVSGYLRVPVKVTLPLPGYIHPDFLVILHHRGDGSYEEVFEPYVREENGQWLATFMVRSFSTFALAERRLSAAQIPTGAEVSFIPEGRAEAARCFCALYNREGQVLGIREAALTEGRQSLRFDCETSAPEYGRVLYLDDAYCPLGAAEDFTVEKG